MARLICDCCSAFAWPVSLSDTLIDLIALSALDTLLTRWCFRNCKRILDTSEKAITALMRAHSTAVQSKLWQDDAEPRTGQAAPKLCLVHDAMMQSTRSGRARRQLCCWERALKVV